MYVAFLVGGIGSGKSTAARRLESLGAARLDLDALSREALAPGSPTLGAVAEAFGRDLVDPATGELDRAGLAGRAFASPEATELLESIELPAIAGLLRARLAALAAGAEPPACCVVEVPLPDRMGPLLSLADEVVAVTCPVSERRVRAMGRGMTGADFDARAARQPDDERYEALADTAIPNDGGPGELAARVDAWWAARAAAGWDAPTRP